MSWSLGEIADLSKKAARGAGFSWGLAEEAAWAVRWLAERNLPGPEALARALTDVDGHCPLGLGVRIADDGDLGAVSTVADVAGPLLCVPFLSRATVRGQGARFMVGGVTFSVGASGSDLFVALPDRGAITFLGPCAQPVAAPLTTRIRNVDHVALHQLETLARRVYAPATARSRELGAGTTGSDND